MKLCPLTALAAVGWYLMVPPSNVSRANAYKRPMNTWRIIRSFDNADDCEDFKANFFDSSRQQRSLGILNPAHRDYMFAECIATDDPRLKAK